MIVRPIPQFAAQHLLRNVGQIDEIRCQLLEFFVARRAIVFREALPFASAGLPSMSGRLAALRSARFKDKIG
jgi:hypothetical protein